MKKYIFYAAAALAVLASCNKTIEDQKAEVVFQVARYQNVTKADPADYKDEYAAVPFGAFSWFKGQNPADNTTFMTNQKVSYNSAKNLWAPEGTTYYWPKTGSLDFICYSPYTADGTNAPLPTVTETGISYPAWDVRNHPVDLMYADKVTGLTNNKNTYYYNGVPTLFRHAFAKVTFAITTPYLEATGENGDKTRWEIIINDITLNNILTTGGLDLTLNSDGTWKKPADNVWNADDTIKENITLDLSGLGTEHKLDGSDQPLDADMFVLPQWLTGGQEVVINVTINTYRDNNDGTGEHLVLTETGVEIKADLSAGSMDRWGINQNVTYTFNVTPSLGTPVDTDGDGVPDDQAPTTVYFDPAVTDWENITVNAGINI